MKQDKDGWLRCEIDRKEMRTYLKRSDAKGLINLAFFLVPLLVIGYAAYLTYDTIWSILLFWAYGSIYGFCNSLLHETHHGTPFKTPWLNEAAHKLAGFMAVRNPTYDRWVHTQHHTETSISVDKDPELSHPQPINIGYLVLDLFWLRAAFNNPMLLLKQVLGQFSKQDQEIIPKKKFGAIRLVAAIMLSIYTALIAASIIYQTWLPLLYTYLAHIYGGLVPRLYALTQHLGLAQSVNDFRLNSRTCLYNPIAAAWYWNMNFHIEHHMYPLVPFHALPTLHDRLKNQLPEPNSSVLNAWCEILFCIKKQRQSARYFIHKPLPSDSSSLKRSY